MSNHNNNIEDDEEDFLALVDGEKRSTVEINTEQIIHPETVDLSSDEHISTTSVATGQPVPNGAREGSTFEEFKSALSDFYARFNFANLDKVPYLAEKFFFRRWELWKQLSMKYHLSPRESSDLWIRFNVRFDGVPECARRLFGSDETVVINSDSSKRREVWTAYLSVPSDSQREQYHKHSVEIRDPSETSSNQPIYLDVVRTHQELSFFQEVS
jgi:hypothetical protein